MIKNIEGVQYFSHYDNKPLSWFDKINLVWTLVLIVVLYSGALFLWGANWMSDLDSYSAQVTAK